MALVGAYVLADQDMAFRNQAGGGAPIEEFADIVNSLSLPGCDRVPSTA